MESQHFANRAGWTIFLYGIFLSFIAAFTPFYDAGYVFKSNVFLVGLLPYLVYAIAVPLLPGTVTNIVGLILVIVHTGLVAGVRLIEGIYNLIYTVPIVMAILIVPLVILALINTDVHKHHHKIMWH